jgi:magnesium transporter
MGYFNKTYHTPGTPPGTLVGREDTEQGELTIRLIDYTSSGFIDKELSSAEECRSYLDNESVTWIHLQGEMSTDTMTNIGEMFGLHPLALEDVLNKGQRPKVEAYDEQLFVILSMPNDMDDSKIIDQVSVFLGENYVISFHSGNRDPFEPLRHRLHKKIGRLQSQKADYLLYCILDLVIDHGYPILEEFGEAIEIIEDKLLDSSIKQDTLTEIHHIRRELLLLRRSLWPQREIINSLMRDDHRLIAQGTVVYFRDCYDHTIQIMDLIENYREMAASLIDVYLSSVSNRLNEIMRVLTMIATIFIPLTFVVGLYGMNFSNPNSPWAMPELHWYYGYPAVWGIMITVVIGMIFYFRRKNWL